MVAFSTIRLIHRVDILPVKKKHKKTPTEDHCGWRVYLSQIKDVFILKIQMLLLNTFKKELF